MRKYLLCGLAAALFLSTSTPACAHCEVPCGIYDDGARLTEILEHATTIEKAMKEIVRLDKEDGGNKNQIVRWVTNKESHASEAQHIVSQYFMTQRIKPGAEMYEKKLTVLHQMLQAAMKCKQTVDTKNADALKAAILEFHKAYEAK